MKQKIKYANFRSARIVEVLKVEVNEGEGTTEDPIRRVGYLVSKKGEVLAKIGEKVKREFAEFAGEDEMIIL